MAARRRRSESQLLRIVARRLREIRTTRGLVQEAVAHAIGISRESYSNLERGNTLPSAETLVALAETFVVSTDSLLGIAPTPSRTGERAAHYRQLAPETVKLLRKLEANNRAAARVIAALTGVELPAARR